MIEVSYETGTRRKIIERRSDAEVFPVAYDAFISYASKDKTIADAVCARLESAGIRCWIAPRDVVAGTSYGEAIIEAIRGTKVMVLVFSSNANSSGHIPKEVERAVSRGMPIIPFRIEDVAPGKSLDYFIGSVHWLDAMTPPMGNHLDNLAATVHKLLPAKPGAQEVPAAQTPAQTPTQTPAQTPDVWQRSTPPPIAPMATPTAPVRPTASRDTARASSSKTIWIGLAAVVVLAAVVAGAILMRSGGNSQTAVTAPVTTNPPGSPSAVTNSSPAGKPAAPSATPESRAPAPSSEGAPSSPLAVKASANPIVGCYQWFNNAAVVIRSDGTMVGGPFTARWQVVSAARRVYTFTWPESTDTVTLAPDQRSLSGANQYGFPTSGTRVAGSSGLVGIWRWPSGLPVTVYPGGTFTAASFHGKWQAIDASRGIYGLTWPNPVDNVVLSTDGSRVSGANQYGVAISGIRTEPCGGN